MQLWYREWIMWPVTITRNDDTHLTIASSGGYGTKTYYRKPGYELIMNSSIKKFENSPWKDDWDQKI